MAGEGGVEPPHTDPETAVLPLDDSPTGLEILASALRDGQTTGLRASFVERKNLNANPDESLRVTSFRVSRAKEVIDRIG